MSEIPVDLVRENFETNVFSALDFYPARGEELGGNGR
jgi:hypothetical protein